MTITYEHTISIRSSRGHSLTVTMKDGKITVIYSNNVITIEKYDDLDTVTDIIYALTKRSHYIYKKAIRKALTSLEVSQSGS